MTHPIDIQGLFSGSTELRTVLKALGEGSFPLLLYGSEPSAFRWFAAALRHKEQSVLVYMEDDSKAKNAAAGIEGAIYLPQKEVVWNNLIAYSQESAIARVEALLRARRENAPILFTSIQNAGVRYEDPVRFDVDYGLDLDREIDPDNLIAWLVEHGYERVDHIGRKGQFSVRGGIVDLYSPLADAPIRLEFFGDQIDSMRLFSLETQLSTERLDSFVVFPAQEHRVVESRMCDSSDASSSAERSFALESYLESPIVFLMNHNLCVARLRGIEAEYDRRFADRLEQGEVSPDEHNAMFRSIEVLDRLAKTKLISTELLLKTLDTIAPMQLVKLASKEVQSYFNKFDALAADLRRWQLSGYKIYLTFFSEEKKTRFFEQLPYDGVTDVGAKGEVAAADGDLEDTIASIRSGQILATVAPVAEGFYFDTFKAILLTENHIYGESKKAPKRKIAGGKKIKAFEELQPGDYVVHEEHGIGVFVGIEQVVVDKMRRDYLKIRYAGDDSLYIPVESTASIQKYLGSDTDKVKISRLGGAEWKRAKRNARKSIEDITDELLDLYAKRRSRIGYAFQPDTEWQKDFEDQFPYEETADQLKSTEEIKQDMEKPVPMERLLCGDVGYGKTEVALRAAFKAVMDSKQVAILVPTTILAQQHYNNIVQRFSKYPARVEMVSRFRTPAEIKKAIVGLKDGSIDILIGTHRLLSDDVQFKNLGLLIIDEEQRFGVKHKEKIKQIKESIDVLTLTATPIPRTLHMSMIGIRDMSVLEDPPEDRYPVQTYVLEYDKTIVREAILRELERGGQVYFVYNRIDSIERITAELMQLVPEASIRFAHGQMKEHQLERVMVDFMNNEFQVLVSTTIIETGLDISNVNTMIIIDGDKYGLSQLYQLRGRVGRSNRIAYCYVFFSENKVLTEIAEKRLRAIREFTELGAGFKIAMRDLEIRGAGNILGTEQSGYLDAIGYELYCKMLDESIRERRGEKIVERVQAKIDFSVNAYIPEYYIVNPQVKLEVYKMISSVRTKEEAMAVYGEIEDRFGGVPDSVDNLLKVSLIKSHCEEMSIDWIGYREGLYELRFAEGYVYSPLFIAKVLEHDSSRISFHAGTMNGFKIRVTKQLRNREQDLAALEKIVETIYSFHSEFLNA